MYFRAKIEKEQVVHFVGLFRSIEDHIAFDRIEKPAEHIFEFFVPIEAKNRFIEIMDLFYHTNIITWYKERDIKESSLFEYKE
jgi:hypothetical protein